MKKTICLTKGVAMKKIYLLFVLSALITNLLSASNKQLTISTKDTLKQAMEKLKTVKGKSKFVFNTNKDLVISLTGKKKPNHKNLLAKSQPLSAGYIEVQLESAKIVKLYLDNRSGNVCPSYESLNHVFIFLADKIKIDGVVNLRNNPNLDKCKK